jgi:hypothetical protein
MLVEPAPPAPAPAPPPPGPAAPQLHTFAALAVDTSGSLPALEVQRAVDRQRAALARCSIASPAAAPVTVSVDFTIGEARRAQGVSVRGAGDATACITQALANVRTESAPDIGEVTVKLAITFAVKV